MATPPKPVNTGLSNIATFSPRLNPRWLQLPDPLNAKRGLRRIDPAHSVAGDDDNALWIDRARVFQTHMAALTGDHGTVDSSINDINPEPGPFDPAGAPKNYCERQGRCIIGCLPGARHTLNKQLMGAHPRVTRRRSRTCISPRCARSTRSRRCPLASIVRARFRNRTERQDQFVSEDEWTANMMCVAAMGREAAVGQFRLGRWGETTLRVRRTDGKQFHEDPIYAEIQASLDRFARELTDAPDRTFINPFLSDTAGALGAKAVGLSHPLGGCGMGRDATAGVVDEFGRVFDTSKHGDRPVHEGLYIADGSCIPTALGVNPSLTVAALALRTADAIIDELPAVAETAPAAAPTT